MKRSIWLGALAVGTMLARGAGAQTGDAATQARALAAQGKLDQAIALVQARKTAPGVEGRRARLALGELLVRAGRRAEAEPVLMTFADDYNNDVITSQDAEGLAMVGRAMHLLRHPKNASDAFKESVRSDAKLVQTHLWWADLLADYFDPGDAQAEYKEALTLAPRTPDALVGLARLEVDDAFDFEGADKHTRDALAMDPKNTGALAVRAGMALRDGDLDAANAAIDAGLAIDPGQLELLSLRAAARFLADDPAGFATAKRAIFARNKEFSAAFGIIGDYAEWEHRYDDVVAMMKEAVALDPKDGKAWAELGLWQTRAGDEAAGVASLEEWWKHDHFNQRAYNTLEKLYTQWIPKDYESATASIFDVRYPKAERAVLERYVPRMLGEAWARMKVHYGFAPTVPVHVELYESRDHFSVRTSGLPNIGIQGVCFGHVVAAMSPASEPFNWGNVVWHELGHVFAIQRSKNHVPRWFTEGLSEYETMVRRPEWQRELDRELYVALDRKRLPAAVDMNRAFTHAGTGVDVTVAYYAASQLVAYTVSQYGWDAVTRALDLWGEGKRTPEVVRGAFGVSPQEYDARWRSWQLARLTRYQGQYIFAPQPVPVDEARAALATSPGSAAAHVNLAVALVGEHKLDDAAKELEAALQVEPANADAHFLYAKLEGGRKNQDGEVTHLQAIRAAGHDGYEVQMGLAEVALTRKDAAGARAALEAAHRFDPTQLDALHGLYEMAVDQKRDGDAMRALREIAMLDQHDRKAWPLLLSRLVDAKQWSEARRVGEAALYVDVENADVHVGYARALSATGSHEEASFELESALLCDAKPADKAEQHALLAAERRTLGDLAGARAHRDQALQLDPGNADAKALKL